MPSKRAHIVLPEELLAELDRVAGERSRSAFLIDLIQRELQRHKLLAALREARGSWKTEDHPELQDGSQAFVERLRAENEGRFENTPGA